MNAALQYNKADLKVIRLALQPLGGHVCYSAGEGTRTCRLSRVATTRQIVYYRYGCV